MLTKRCSLSLLRGCHLVGHIHLQLAFNALAQFSTFGMLQYRTVSLKSALQLAQFKFQTVESVETQGVDN